MNAQSDYLHPSGQSLLSAHDCPERLAEIASAFANRRICWGGGRERKAVAQAPHDPVCPAAEIPPSAAAFASRLAFAAKISMVAPHFAPEGGNAASAPPRSALRT